MHYDEIKALLEVGGHPCVSIYMPTHRAGRETEKSPIHLKNLLADAESRIGEKRQADAILAPARELLAPGTQFWSTADLGLALFLSSSQSRIIKLPKRVDQHVYVGEEFYIRPLLPMLDEQEHFYVIALEQDDPRLYRATRNDIELVREPAWRESIEELVYKTELPADVGFHPAGPSSTTGEGIAAKYHALGESPEDYRQIELDRMVLGVAKAVSGFLKDRRVPLVVIGEPNLLGQFRKHNRYNHLLEEAVSRNPSHMDDASIHEQALDIVTKTVAQPAQAALKMFAETPPERIGRVTDDIVFGALDGRISHLLVAKDAELRGRLDGDARRLTLSGDSEDGRDLVDVIAKAAIRNGGKVFVYDRVEMPEEQQIAAIFRY